jgi:nicotinate-nucleotide pyrophosphorylase (carboxylating)
MINALGYRATVENALREDRADLDLTTLAIIPAEAIGQARIVSKAPGVIAGLPVAKEVYDVLDTSVTFRTVLAEGTHMEPGALAAELTGPMRSLLSGERVALNFLQHLSGIATITSSLCALIRDYPARLLDTRKTIPGLRELEKYAVQVGGGLNHRHTLADLILIKDNHIAAAGGIGEAVRRARAYAPAYIRIEVETENEEQVLQALAAGADIIMLDNMPPEEMAAMVKLVAGRAKLEASGNINTETIRDVAATGVDFISVGAITHSAPALDLSMEMEVLEGDFARPLRPIVPV